MIEDSNFVLKIKEWDTSATHYPIKSLGNVAIRRLKQKPGYYLMEGVRGYYYYQNTKTIPITYLTIGLETVMVDDPLQWCGMQDLAKHCKGKVLIAGLGLGLVLHGLQSNKDVTEIHVIEWNRDVITLMENHIPRDERINIIQGDFWEYIETAPKDYDTVLLDIWWGDRSSEMGIDMYVLELKVKHLIPNAKVMIWGLRDPKINPAVTILVDYI